jgi:short-subunit dehydrogenase
MNGTGVKISALCPGFTRTEFHERGRMSMNALPEFMWLSSDRVVLQAWKENQKGRVITIPGWQYLILSFLSRFGPRPLVRKLGMNVRVRQRQK